MRNVEGLYEPSDAKTTKYENLNNRNDIAVSLSDIFLYDWAWMKDKTRSGRRATTVLLQLY